MYFACHSNQNSSLNLVLLRTHVDMCKKQSCKDSTNLAKMVWEKKLFKGIVDGRTQRRTNTRTNGGRLATGHYKSLP